MDTVSTKEGLVAEKQGADFFDCPWEESWTLIKTVVDVVREPMLVLDKDLCVMTANESFYQIFQIEPKNTEGKVVYQLGDGQWNIPELRRLLEEILPKNIFFKGFEVAHDFPLIGRKIMFLNGRQIHCKEMSNSKVFSPVILLAMEDVTEMMNIAEKLASHTKQFEDNIGVRTRQTEHRIKKLEKEIENLKTKSQH